MKKKLMYLAAAGMAVHAPIAQAADLFFMCKSARLSPPTPLGDHYMDTVEINTEALTVALKFHDDKVNDAIEFSNGYVASYLVGPSPGVPCDYVDEVTNGNGSVAFRRKLKDKEHCGITNEDGTFTPVIDPPEWSGVIDIHNALFSTNAFGTKMQYQCFVSATIT